MRATISPTAPTIFGWNSLAIFLHSLGLSATANSLELLRRRHGLPCRGGHRNGSPVHFDSHDVDEWVRHLTGGSLKGWLARHIEPAGKLVRARRLRGSRSRGVLLPHDLYAITHRSPGAEEQVHRLPDGEVSAALDPVRMQDYVSMGVILETPGRCWRYLQPRRALPSDLLLPTPRSLPRLRSVANKVVGAFTPHEQRLSWCHVPGRFFNLAETVTTPFLASRALPRFGEALAWLRANQPAAVFVVWVRRVSVDPITMDEMPHPGLEQLLKGLGA